MSILGQIRDKGVNLVIPEDEFPEDRFSYFDGSVLVRLKDDEVAFARDYEDRVSQTDTLKTENYTGLNEAGRYYVGEVGTLAVVAYLRSCGVDLEYKPKSDGLSDKGDIVVPKIDGVLRMDVKTGSKRYYRKLMMPEAQFLKKKCDVYVGCLLMDKVRVVRICGWLDLEDFTRRSVLVEMNRSVLTREFELGDLKPIGELVEYLAG